MSVMPTSAYAHVKSLPAALSGQMSPNPTVVLVLPSQEYAAHADTRNERHTSVPGVKGVPRKADTIKK